MPNTARFDRGSLLLSQALQRDSGPVTAEMRQTSMSLIIHHGPAAIPSQRGAAAASVPASADLPFDLSQSLPGRDGHLFGGRGEMHGGSVRTFAL